MRFAWLREKGQASAPEKPGFANNFIFFVYNAVFCLPLLLVIFGQVEAETAFYAFALIIALRAVANWYRNNLMPIEAAQVFPLRSP